MEEILFFQQIVTSFWNCPPHNSLYLAISLEDSGGMSTEETAIAWIGALSGHFIKLQFVNYFDSKHLEGAK